MIIFLSVLLGILFLLLFPVFIYINIEGEPELYFRILYFIKLKIPTESDKPEKSKKKASKAGKPAVKEKEKPNILETLREYADISGDLVKKGGNTLRKLKLWRLLLHVNISGEAPDTTAILFGAACAVIYPALSILSSAMGFDPSSKRCDIRIIPDYSGGGSGLKMRAKIYFIPLMLLVSAISLAYTVFRGLRLRSN